MDPCAAADPSDLAMQAGRPLIVVPPKVQWLDLRSVLVAWKDVREAELVAFERSQARAVISGDDFKHQANRGDLVWRRF